MCIAVHAKTTFGLYITNEVVKCRILNKGKRRAQLGSLRLELTHAAIEPEVSGASGIRRVAVVDPARRLQGRHAENLFLECFGHLISLDSLA